MAQIMILVKKSEPFGHKSKRTGNHPRAAAFDFTNLNSEESFISWITSGIVIIRFKISVQKALVDLS
jgi:hypothetical protein